MDVLIERLAYLSNSRQVNRIRRQRTVEDFSSRWLKLERKPKSYHISESLFLGDSPSQGKMRLMQTSNSNQVGKLCQS